MAAELGSARHELARQQGRLTALSPQATLDRGYAVLRDGTGTPVMDPAALTTGTPLDARVARGQFSVTVTDITTEDG